MHPKVVSERLGHATVSTTLRTHGGPGYRLSSVKVGAAELRTVQALFPSCRRRADETGSTYTLAGHLSGGTKSAE